MNYILELADSHNLKMCTMLPHIILSHHISLAQKINRNSYWYLSLKSEWMNEQFIISC